MMINIIKETEVHEFLKRGNITYSSLLRIHTVAEAKSNICDN